MAFWEGSGGLLGTVRGPLGPARGAKGKPRRDLHETMVFHAFGALLGDSGSQNSRILQVFGPRAASRDHNSVNFGPFWAISKANHDC